VGKSFRELSAWQYAIKLNVCVYNLTGSFPSSEKFGLVFQLRRAAVSVASNIAEGYGRMTRGEYLQFLGQARGSLSEVETQLVIARAIGIGNASDIDMADQMCALAGRILNGLIKSLRTEPRANGHCRR
jgi:four helix bundle protein